MKVGVIKKAIARIIFFPALIAWVFFAPLYRFANWLTHRWGINRGYSTWYWFQVQATDHPVHYDVYDSEY